MGLLSLFSKREANSRLENLVLVNTAVEHLTAALNTYQGGMIAALPISRSEVALITAMKNAIKDAQATPNTTASDAAMNMESKELVEYLRTTLHSSMQANMVALRADKDHLAAANVLSIMMLEIKGLQQLTHQLFEVMFGNSPQDLLEESRRVTEAIDAEFASVIQDCS